MSQSSKQKPTIKSIGKLLLKIYLGIFLVLILVWGLNLGWHVVNLYGLAKNLKADTTQIQAVTIVPLIEETARDMDAMYGQLRPLFPIFNALQGLPGMGDYFGPVDPLLTYGNGLAQAGKE